MKHALIILLFSLFFGAHAKALNQQHDNLVRNYLTNLENIYPNISQMVQYKLLEIGAYYTTKFEYSEVLEFNEIHAKEFEFKGTIQDLDERNNFYLLVTITKPEDGMFLKYKTELSVY